MNAKEVFTLFARVATNKQEFANDMDQMEGKAKSSSKKMGGAFSGVGKAVKVGILGALTSVIALLGTAGVASFKFATEFEAGMQNVSTLIGGNVERTDELAEAVKQLPAKTGKPLSDLTAGLYQVVSAYGDSAETAEILELNARAASAGLATTEQSIALISAVTKGWGDTSLEAQTKVSDLAFMTVKLGQTDFPQLAGSIGKVVPLTEKLKISQEEMFAVFATATGVTGTAAEVVGLKSLDDYEFPLSWEASLGYKLMQLYKQEVVCERSKKLSEAI